MFLSAFGRSVPRMWVSAVRSPNRARIRPVWAVPVPVPVRVGLGSRAVAEVKAG